MATSIWPSVSGAIAQSHTVDTVANNLANQDTLGFKKDQPVFREYLSVVERERYPEEVKRSAPKEKDFYPIDGKDQSYVIVDGTYTNFRQGNLRVTQSPLDLALDGPGFLEVSTPTGIRYTRQGSLKMAMDGRLVTIDGFPVLASNPGGLASAQSATAVQPNQGGTTTQGGVAAGQGNDSARFINLRDRGGNIAINEQGEIYAGDELVAKISVKEFQSPHKLRKSGGNLFENSEITNISANPSKTIVRQGMVETSNVNPIEEMTNLIKANRMFENDLKAMKTYNDLLGREANDLGKL